jgi:cytochrome c-type biogenesis protein CcmH
MRSWTLPVALGLAVALIGLGVTLGLRDGSAAAPDARAASLAAELRCPDCQGLSVADSPTRSAREIRAQIDELVAGGATDDEVREHFVARYGEWVRLAPSAPAVWIIPFGVVVAAAAALIAWLAARRGPPAIGEVSSLTDAERRRLREEADSLDA